MRLSVILVFLQLWWKVEVSLSQNACSMLPLVPLAFVSDATQKAEYEKGDVIDFTCEMGYISSSTIKYVCIAGGWLEVLRERCYLKPCELPDDTPDGYYNIINGDELVFGTVIQYFCNEGYQMVGKDDKRTCLLDGWSKRTPICRLTKCKLPTTRPEGTQYNPPYQTEFLAGDTITVTCGERYGILNSKSRSAVIACNENMEWDNEPECIEVKCNRPEDPLVNRWSFWAQTNLDYTVRYSCIAGYQKPSVATVATCTRDGWIPAPLCQEKECRKIPIEHASISNDKSHFSHGEEVQYTCTNSGTQFTVTCDRGQWRGIMTCPDALTCETPPPLLDGDIKNSLLFKYNHNDRVEYICQKFYIMEGEPYMTCINGQWTGRMRCLQPCIVTKADLNSHNIMFTYIYEEKLYTTHNDEIDFTCLRGRRHDGVEPMRQRCIHGAIKLPTCQ